MIGILAGMGPKSTAPFVDKVVQLCQQLYGAKYDIDFPPMMIYSCPTPFYLDRPLDHLALEAAIIAGARKLAATGVDFIAIPCNTAHAYFANISRAVNSPILNMVDETLRVLPPACRRIALLATPATVESGVYQAGLAERGHECLPPANWQPLVNETIAAIKGADEITAVAKWQKLLQRLEGQADAIVLACTDLNAVADRCPPAIRLIDAGHALARAAVDRYYKSHPQK